jgi:arylsulfatase A-like enzyme
MAEHPNLLFVFSDQWRGQATGYAGDSNAITPNLDRLSSESVVFSNAVSGCPVCSPYRASLVTGQYPHTHGVVLNDVYLQHRAVSIADAFNGSGYNTGWIGKWHLDGHGRTRFTPPERRQGFRFWRAVECTHDYNNSIYYGDSEGPMYWEGYDAFAQTREAQRYIKEYSDKKPFALFLSWGPPHAPYETAPEEYRRMFSPESIKLRPNVPVDSEQEARKSIAGYYAHIAALDAAMGQLLKTLKESGREDDTVVIFTSDHGDMHGSQGQVKKQKPWEESLLVPFLLRYPPVFGRKHRIFSTPFNATNIMPTLLSLCGVEIPETVEGKDFAGALRGETPPPEDTAVVSCYIPFGQWPRSLGGRECRGIRTERYTYVRDLNGPWLLYDNQKDPYQTSNLCNKPEYSELQAKMESILKRRLLETNDEFLPSRRYIEKWGYTVDENETVPYWLKE